MHPHHRHLRVRARRSALRRSAAGVAIAVAVAGISGVAEARSDVERLVEDIAVTTDAGSWGRPASVLHDLAAGWGAGLASVVSSPGRASSPAGVFSAEEAVTDVQPSAEEQELERIAALLMDTYEWGERSLRVGGLQQLLGVTVDGWYARQTLRAHEAALLWSGLPSEHLPEAPPPPPKPAPSARSGGPSASQWAALRQCESSGNYRATNPSGKYRGAYQFDQPTWNSVASRRAPHLVGVDPAAASPGDQDAMARALYSDRGRSPWPSCGRHLG
jgi:hypothetical protein